MLFTQSMNSSKKTVLNDAIVYYHNSFPLEEIHTFNEALNPAVWNSYLKPFACVITHHHSDETILVRDHLGVEPLYYCHYLGKRLIVAQSIPEILNQLPNTPSLLQSQIDMLFSEFKVYTDETHFQGIFRVEPGYLMHFKSNGTVIKKAFWKLDPHKPLLHYDNKRDYHDHFSMLMTEAVQHSTEKQTNIAAEFSAGLDSSAIYCAAANLNINPTLFMHSAGEGKSALTYNDYYEKAFLQHYQLDTVQRIGAEHFDPIQVFSDYAALFSGPAPYLFPMFASSLHRAVAAGQHPILLSGFGGDQCVSGQLPLNFFLPELINQGKYRDAWRAIICKQSIKKMLIYAKHTHPKLYAVALDIKVMKKRLNNAFRSRNAYQPTLLHPYERMYYPSVREVECSLLQGVDSHEVRMRIESSSIVSKTLGFEYRYPLLYPKLLEYMLTVPTFEKRRDGQGRYLIRHYLSQCLPGDIFGTYRKQDGLGIVGSTFDFFQKQFEQGAYLKEFGRLPYENKVKHQHNAIEIRNTIKAYMLNAASLNLAGVNK